MDKKAVEELVMAWLEKDCPHMYALTTGPAMRDAVRHSIRLICSISINPILYRDARGIITEYISHIAIQKALEGLVAVGAFSEVESSDGTAPQTCWYRVKESPHKNKDGGG